MKPLHIPNVPPGGWLILIGGGEFSFGETEEIDRFLLGKLSSQNRRLVFLPTASGSQDYARHFGDYLRKLDDSVDVQNVPVFRGRDAKRGKNLDAIRVSGGAYIGGGQTNPIISTLRDTPVVEELRLVLERGGVIAAIGAGAAALGVVAHDMQRSGNLPALGLLPHTIVETSFSPENDRPLRELMALPEVQLGIAIPPRTALAIGPDGMGTIVGEGSVAVVRKPAS